MPVVRTTAKRLGGSAGVRMCTNDLDGGVGDVGEGGGCWPGKFKSRRALIMCAGAPSAAAESFPPTPSGLPLSRAAFAVAGFPALTPMRVASRDRPRPVALRDGHAPVGNRYGDGSLSFRSLATRSRPRRLPAARRSPAPCLAAVRAPASRSAPVEPPPASSGWWEHPLVRGRAGRAPYVRHSSLARLYRRRHPPNFQPGGSFPVNRSELTIP